MNWSRNGEPCGSVAVQSEERSVRLIYRHLSNADLSGANLTGANVTITPDRTWKKTKRNIIVLLIVCAITAGLLQFFGSPFSLEELIVGVLAIGVFVAFQLGDYFELRLQSLENRLETADGVASVVAAETSIVENLNGLRQQLMHLEKEVDFIART